jgi:hypothetical protein
MGAYGRMPYTFEFVGRDGRSDHFDLMSCPDDQSATVAAGTALRHSRAYSHVEVWSGERRVARIEEHVSWPDGDRSVQPESLR